ncbi:MAG: DUF2914 domain-containing protein [Pseudomonadota bacterium]|nr:DUF2914 domain-containing protein [Pseudomonadota bacterium]
MDPHAQAPAAVPPPPVAAPLPSWVPRRLESVYRRVAPYLGALAFIAGFTWDSLTLTRVDRLLDNFILLTYLLGLGAMLVLHHRTGVFRAAWPRLAPRRELLDFAARWCFGGLYSAYVVLYFKSASTWPSLLFVVLLAALMLVHELRPAERPRMRVSFFCLCAFSFLLFFIPVVSGYLGPWVFPAAGALALLGGVTLGWAMERGARAPSAIFRRHLAASAIVLVPMFVLDKLEMIPPIPLALLDRGVFHDVTRTDAGFEVRYERAAWPSWRREDRVFHIGDAQPAFCFTAVFAPHGIDVGIVHAWEWWDPASGWSETDRIPYEVEGGRGGGYRVYTKKRALRAGEWRVRVLTDAGRELGRCEFTAVEGEGEGVRWGSRIID